MTADGTDVIPPLAGQFQVPRGGGFNNLILGMGMAFPAHGEYVFVLRVDNVQLDTWKITVARRPDSKR